MFNFDEPRYEKVVSDALALRPQIEAAVDKVCEQGYSGVRTISWTAPRRIQASCGIPSGSATRGTS